MTWGANLLVYQPVARAFTGSKLSVEKLNNVPRGTNEEGALALGR
jgi:hypothetical protein